MAVYAYAFDDEVLRHVAKKIEQVREAFGQPIDDSMTELGASIAQVQIEVLDPWSGEDVVGTIEYHDDGYFVFYPKITVSKKED